MRPTAIKTDGRIFDFILMPCGRKAELKFESYSGIPGTPGYTGNFFIEAYSLNKYGDPDLKAIGGPWRALRDGVDLYIDIFVGGPEVAMFGFNTTDVVRRADELIRKRQLKLYPVDNPNHTTYGYLMKIEWFRGLYLFETFKDYT